MSPEVKDDRAATMLKAGKTWIITAIVMTTVFSGMICLTGANAKTVGYISSIISFMSCVFAGAAAQRAKGGGALYTGLIFGAAMTVALLTLGFIIGGGNIEPSGVISVATFSVAGSCCGSVIFGGKRSTKKTKKRK